MKMARFLVTGGCGFIGSHLCDRLLDHGHQVSVLDDLSTGREANLDPRCRLIVADVADAEAVAKAMDGVSGCFHLAAVASVQRSVEDWLGSHRANLTGAVTVFDAARRAAGGPVPVVYASSAAVYGDGGDRPLAEATPLRPLTAYGADKLGCELHARVAWLVHRVPTVGLRFFNVFGPRQDPRSPYSGVISIFADRLLAGRPLAIHGDGTQTRDFVHVGDVVDHLMAAMADPAREPRVVNVCTGRATTILALAEIIGRIVGIRPEVEAKPSRPGDIRASLGDPALARARLGVSASTSLGDGLRRTILRAEHRFNAA
jgi:UDP-glucose 4-epimerase